MSRVRRYFYVNGMRIPSGRGLVDLPDGSTRRVILPDEGMSGLDAADAVSSDDADGTITLKDLVGSGVTTVRVPCATGVIELPFDATKARGRQGRNATREVFDDVFSALTPALAGELALMQVEMMPKSAKSGATEARMRLAAALSHLPAGTMASAIQDNPDALAHADDEIVTAMFSHDPLNAATLAMWSVGHKRGEDWTPSAVDATNRFSTLVMCSSAASEDLKNSITKRYVSQLAKRAVHAAADLEMLATQARADMAMMPAVMHRVLHKITASNTVNDREIDVLAARFEYRSMPQNILDEQAFDAAESTDSATAEEIITHAGDLVSQDAFEVLLQVAPSLAIATHPERITKELAGSVTEIETALAQQRPDLLMPAQRREYLLNPRRRSIAPSFAKTMTDQELDMISKAEHQIRAIVDDGDVAPMLINRLIGPRRNLALAMVVADLKENIQLGHDSMDFIRNREERRLIEDALASTDAATREELVAGLTAKDRFDGLFIASQLTIAQLHDALIDAAARLGVVDGDHRAPRASLQSFVSRTDALLHKAGRDDRTALSSGLAYAAELLSGELDGEFSKQFQPAPVRIDAPEPPMVTEGPVVKAPLGAAPDNVVVDTGDFDLYDELDSEFLQAMGEFPDVEILVAALGDRRAADAQADIVSIDITPIQAPPSLFDQDDLSDHAVTTDASTDALWAREYEAAIARYFATAPVQAVDADNETVFPSDDEISDRVDLDDDIAAMLDHTDVLAEQASTGIDEDLVLTTEQAAPAPPAAVAADAAVSPAAPVAAGQTTIVTHTSDVIPTVGIQLAIEIRVIAPEGPAVAVATPQVTAASDIPVTVEPAPPAPAVATAPAAPAAPAASPVQQESFAEFLEDFLPEITAPVQLELPVVSAVELFDDLTNEPAPLMTVTVEPSFGTMPAPAPAALAPLPAPRGASFDPGFSINESHLDRLVEQQNARDAIERSPKPAPVEPAATLPAATASGALESAVAEYNRLKDEEAVFAVMTTSSKKKAEVRFALKQLKHVEKKIDRIQNLIERYKRM